MPPRPIPHAGATFAAGLLAAGALALLAAMPSSAQDPGPGPDAAARGQFIASGGYLEQTGSALVGRACFECHGLYGEGDAGAAIPRLADQSTWYLYKSLRDYASEIRYHEIMTPIAQALTDAQMQDVAVYYGAIGDAPLLPTPADPPSDLLEVGEGIATAIEFGDGLPGCVWCHGERGVGMAPAFPYLAGQPAAYLQRQLEFWRTGQRDGDPLDVMERIARLLTPEQMAAVSLYFALITDVELTPEEPLPLVPHADAVTTPRPVDEAVPLPGVEGEP